MEENTTVCYRCKYFKRYYIKCAKEFSKTKLGWCDMSQDSVNAIGNCENYEAAQISRLSAKRIKRCLNDIMRDIRAIRYVIESESKEDINDKMLEM